MTRTCEPPGSGFRAGIDRDLDGVLDGDDICPNVFNPEQADSDHDGVGDACDNCTVQANADQRDTDGAHACALRAHPQGGTLACLCSWQPIGS